MSIPTFIPNHPKDQSYCNQRPDDTEEPNVDALVGDVKEIGGGLQ